MFRPAARAPTPGHVWTGVPAPARPWTGVIGLTVLALAVGLVGLSTVSSHAATGDETDYADDFELKSAYSFVVLAGSAITSTGLTVLTGDVGIHPNDDTSVTGFPPGIINGQSHLGDGEAPQAKLDLDEAYTDVANLPSDGSLPVELGDTSPPPGVYSGVTFGITGTLPLVLEGSATDVWVFQMDETLITGPGSQVELRGDANPCNVFWQVGSSATLDEDSYFVGTIMAHTSITLVTGASVDGRLLALGGAVTLDANDVTRPVCTTAAAEPPADPPAQPIVEPTVEPTDEPTVEPTDEATVEPTVEPTDGTTDETIVDEPTTDVPTTDVPTTTDEPTVDEPTQGVVPPTRIDTGAGGASSGGPGVPTLLVGALLVAAVTVRRATHHRGRRLVS